MSESSYGLLSLHCSIIGKVIFSLSEIIPPKDENFRLPEKFPGLFSFLLELETQPERHRT